jgi:hypothetical protein
MAETLNNSPWMEWVESIMGGVSPASGSRLTATAALRPDRYYCLLDELPLHLIPQSARTLASAGESTRELSLNPACEILDGRHLPEHLAKQEELFSAFAMAGTIAWVRDSAGCLFPFWLSRHTRSLLNGLRPGQKFAGGFPAAAVRLLFAAGILISPQDDADARFRSQESLSFAFQMFRHREYAPLPRLIHPFHVAALRRYYRYLIRAGRIPLGDGQSARRYVAYNEPVARFFHRQITAIVSKVVGEPVKPSYVYLASYLSGAQLPRHKDREQCEFSVTFCLDFSPEPRAETPWPIQLQTASGNVKVYQGVGDGLLYRGTKLPHYRDPLAEGRTSTSIFFHYVAADFQGSLD